MFPITYSCPHCEAGPYEVDINLPSKDMTCPRCGYKITTGELPGGGEFRSIEVCDEGRLTESSFELDTWEARWEKLSPEARATEIQLMDEHVAFWEEREPPMGHRP